VQSAVRERAGLRKAISSSPNVLSEQPQFLHGLRRSLSSLVGQRHLALWRVYVRVSVVRGVPMEAPISAAAIARFGKFRGQTDLSLSRKKIYL
jgi:hypothetical protein